MLLRWNGELSFLLQKRAKYETALCTQIALLPKTCQDGACSLHSKLFPTPYKEQHNLHLKKRKKKKVIQQFSERCACKQALERFTNQKYLSEQLEKVCVKPESFVLFCKADIEQVV